MPGKKYVPILIIIMLTIALGFTSSAAFAYWQDVSRVGNVVIRFEGESANLIVDEKHDTFTGMLVPVGYVNFEGEVDQVVFEYEVSIDKTLVRTMNLVVQATEIKIGDSETYAQLVSISINNQQGTFEGELFNSKVTVRIVVRLLEPIDEAEAIERGLNPELVNVENSRQAFDAIKGQTISFKITFSVTPRVAEE